MAARCQLDGGASSPAFYGFEWTEPWITPSRYLYYSTCYTTVIAYRISPLLSPVLKCQWNSTKITRRKSGKVCLVSRNELLMVRVSGSRVGHEFNGNVDALIPHPHNEEVISDATGRVRGTESALNSIRARDRPSVHTQHLPPVQ